MIDIQKIAREAGYPEAILEFAPKALERFATLYREALIAELVAESGEPVIGLSTNDGMDFYTADQLAGAVLRERERLALLDWTEILREGALVTWGDAETLGDRVAAAIRSGG